MHFWKPWIAPQWKYKPEKSRLSASFTFVNLELDRITGKLEWGLPKLVVNIGQTANHGWRKRGGTWSGTICPRMHCPGPISARRSTGCSDQEYDQRGLEAYFDHNLWLWQKELHVLFFYRGPF